VSYYKEKEYYERRQKAVEWRRKSNERRGKKFDISKNLISNRPYTVDSF